MIGIQLTVFLPNEIAFATSAQVYSHSILLNKKDDCCTLCSRLLKLFEWCSFGEYFGLWVGGCWDLGFGLVF